MTKKKQEHFAPQPYNSSEPQPNKEYFQDFLKNYMIILVYDFILSVQKTLAGK